MVSLAAQRIYDWKHHRRFNIRMYDGTNFTAYYNSGSRADFFNYVDRNGMWIPIKEDYRKESHERMLNARYIVEIRDTTEDH